ncbi:unnamed protein product [Paramecium sonneborni]|uniref:Uncharacterized protein n=1 Tax=Paramecium sonneborni TaxID=65129 RepID=A0A8S1JZ63_9CILI|nr:unnamed protein product [Paramecium sonneborni]
MGGEGERSFKEADIYVQMEIQYMDSVQGSHSRQFNLRKQVITLVVMVLNILQKRWL